MSSQWNIKRLVCNNIAAHSCWCAKLNKFSFVFCVLIAITIVLNCIDIANGHLIQIDNNNNHNDNAFRAALSSSSLSSSIFVPHIDAHAPHAHPLHHHYAGSGHAKSKKELSAAEVMVDISNDLTYRILHYHSILNRNNFAFSPTALMSILLALYEGSAGRSASELKNVLFLPNNRDVVRVGYRDIHRRLRTYFFETENPLRGLCMNRANITVTPDYETVLMFYGYDIGMDMLSPTAQNATKNTISSTTMMTTMMPTTTTTTSTTTTEMPTTTTSSTSTTTTTTTSTTTPKPTTTTTTTTTTEEPTRTVETTPIEQESTTEAEQETSTTESVETTTSTTDASSGESADLISAFVAEENSEPLLRIQKARVVRLPNAKLQAPPRTNYLPQSARKMAAARMARSKRHLWESVDLDANFFLSLLKPEQFLQQQIPESYFATDLEPPAHFNFRTSSTSQNQQQQYNTDVINHVFYLNNDEIIHTTFKVYNAVLYYKYYEQLRLNVLELELDTKQYNLMILLPDFHVDLTTAAASLRLGPTLRTMRQQLKPRWVQAIIPDFHLHGTMFLTNDLQNLGISDIFEPNRADLRPMTAESGVYVKHIEQNINVHIRTHPINQHKRNYGGQTQPIQLSVNHPFMFFIIDRDLDVAVMAGRVLNPLNVRIQ